MPAAQSSVFWPLQVNLQAVVPPHSMEQPALPAHSAVHPPCGHLMVHLLLPVHWSVEPTPRLTEQSLPPPHVTVLFVPVSMLQSLVPLHVAVQFDSHDELHVDWPSHVVVQPVPHAASHVPFASQ